MLTNSARTLIGRGERRHAYLVPRAVAVEGEGGFGGRHHYIVFINVGRVPAYDVRVAMHRQDRGTAALRLLGDDGTSVEPVLKTAHLPAGGEFHRAVRRELRVGNPHRLSGVISWRDTRWKRLTEPFDIEFTE